MDKNYWKTDNENGYKYQFMAVANAIRAVHTKKVKNIDIPVYDIKENKYVDLYFNIITGNLYIFLKDE